MKMVMFAGRVNVGAVLSLTVMVCTCVAAVLPQLSVRLQVLVITLLPWHGPFTVTSANVAFNPVEQLSASLVTSPVTVVDAL